MKVPILEKIVNLMKDQKYEHQSIFPFWGWIKPKFRDKYGKPNIFSKNSSCCQVFSPNCQKMTLWHHWGEVDAPHDGVAMDAPMTVKQL